MIDYIIACAIHSNSLDSVATFSWEDQSVSHKPQPHPHLLHLANTPFTAHPDASLIVWRAVEIPPNLKAIIIHSFFFLTHIIFSFLRSDSSVQ